MQWLKNQTDRDWDAQWLAMEALRHERRAHQDSLVGPIETTPANEPIPQRSMAQLREDKLMEDVGEVKRMYHRRTRLTEDKVEDGGDEIKY